MAQMSTLQAVHCNNHQFTVQLTRICLLLQEQAAGEDILTALNVPSVTGSHACQEGDGTLLAHNHALKVKT